MDRKRGIRGASRSYPVIKLDDAIEVARAVKELGGYATKKELSESLKIRGGGLNRKIASTKKWGLLTGTGEMKLTDLSRTIFYPTEEDYPERAKIKSFMGVELFRAVYKRFKEEGKLPRDNILKNILIAKYDVREKDAVTVANIIRKSVSTFIPFDKDVEVSDIEGEIPDETGVSDEISKKIKKKISYRQRSDLIYKISKKLGMLETLSSYEDKIKPQKSEILSIINDIESVSDQFKSLHNLIRMTKEEFLSNDINASTVLKRAKFFSKTLEEEIGISEDLDESAKGESAEGETGNDPDKSGEPEI